MRLNPKVVGLIVGATVSEGSSGNGGPYKCPFSIPDGWDRDGLTREMVRRENHAAIARKLAYVTDDPVGAAEKLCQVERICDIDDSARIIEEDEFDSLDENTKQACRTSSATVPVIEQKSPKQRQSTIQKVKAWNANRKREKAEALREAGVLKEAFKFALDNPLTVGVCTYAADRRSGAGSIIKKQFSRKKPEIRKQEVDRLLHLKGSGYTDNGCVRPGTEKTEPACAEFIEEVTEGVKRAKLCAAWDCLDLDNDYRAKESDEVAIGRAVQSVYGSGEPTECSQQLGYPNLDFLVGTAGADAIRNNRRRAAGRDPRSVQQRDTSEGGAGLVTAVAAVGAVNTAASTGSCILF